jgi:crotonobetainyl-CoA:carnitine CoA-transferase CaiB-like acyl-CoA transferase
MHERGMLIEIDHPDYGPITVPHSPLRFVGQPQAEYRASPAYAMHNYDVMRELLNLDMAEVDALHKDGVM